VHAKDLREDQTSSFHLFVLFRNGRSSELCYRQNNAFLVAYRGSGHALLPHHLPWGSRERVRVRARTPSTPEVIKLCLPKCTRQTKTRFIYTHFIRYMLCETASVV
jgi:hypothetical protein